MTTANGVPFPMANGQRIYQPTFLCPPKPKGETHKLRPGDGQTPPSVAMHRRNRPRLSTQTHCAVQQQLANSELGYNDGVKEISRSHTTGPSISTMTHGWFSS